MSLMKAPRLDQTSALALRTILRLSFAKAVRASVEEAMERRQSAAESTYQILNLVTMLDDHTQLLDVAMAMMEQHETESALIPMNDDIFTFYSRVIDLELADGAIEKLRSMSGAQENVDAILKQRDILRKSFDNAMLIDPDEIRRKGGNTPVVGGGFVN